MTKRTRLLWSIDDDLLLSKYVAEKQVTKWSEVGKIFIPNKTGKQCKERWINNLDPSLKKTMWSEQEDELVMYLQSIVGNKWTQIATGIPGRSENDVKNRWYSSLHKKSKLQKLRELSPQPHISNCTLEESRSSIHHPIEKEMIMHSVSQCNSRDMSSQYYKLDMLKAITAQDNHQYHYSSSNSLNSLLNQLPNISTLSPFVYQHHHEAIIDQQQQHNSNNGSIYHMVANTNNTTYTTTQDSIVTQDSDCMMLSSIADDDHYMDNNQYTSNSSKVLNHYPAISFSLKNESYSNIMGTSSTKDCFNMHHIAKDSSNTTQSMTTSETLVGVNYITSSNSSNSSNNNSGGSTPTSSMYNLLFSACNSPNWLTPSNNTGNNSPNK